ncbi:hypothetical protein LJA01_25840 [Lactobacillus japonicus]|nr:hypothetical protein LJA01_25840 [Lactobacillus japonicus]
MSRLGNYFKALSLLETRTGVLYCSKMLELYLERVRSNYLVEVKNIHDPHEGRLLKNYFRAWWYEKKGVE